MITFILAVVITTARILIPTPIVYEEVNSPTAGTTPSVYISLIEEFGEESIMLEIARCESQLRQFDTQGDVLLGKINPHDIGVFQINTDHHLTNAERVGMDIYTLEGNIEYARLLYNQQGIQPWAWSNDCHHGLD